MIPFKYVVLARLQWNLLQRRVAPSKSQVTGGEMAEEKRAELYTSPGGKFVRADTLSRTLAHWRSFRTPQKQTHFIKFDGELYVGDDVDKLHLRTL